MAKRIVICADGTWNSPEEKHVTNVVKIARAVHTRDGEGVEQVVFYDWGVGTFDTSDRIMGGAFGNGINRNIQDAYRFLSHNYRRGDDIFCFGFSRGAYTVRSLVGLIRNAGVLRKEHADQVKAAYKLYRSPETPDSARSREFRDAYAREVDIEFLGVFDTVGALGIPLGVSSRHNERKYGFHDTRITSIVNNAHHALAIDEKRRPFKPTLWTCDEARRNTSQVWFAGVHADIGGGYAEAGLSDEALEWMADRAESCGLALDRPYLRSIADRSAAKLHESYTGAYKAQEPHIRPIGKTNHDEALHPSVGRRREQHDRYRPENLEVHLGNEAPGSRRKRKRRSRRRTGRGRVRG